ncbi:MAG: DHH family phosphoesterase [Spirochaetes bacterium]|nr:DHH family phosphoesterase [Spirochaetota bacterium]
MNIDFEGLAKNIIALLQGQENVAIIIKGSPDPDAIASSYFFWKICTIMHVNASIFCFMPASLPSNRALISMFNIPVKIVASINEIKLKRYSGYIVCDYQTARLEDEFSSTPCIIHLDHHTPAEHDVPASIRILTDEVSSTSTLCVLLMQHISFLSMDDISELSTILYVGIKTDSDGFSHMNEYDTVAIEYIKPYCDIASIQKIENTPLTPYTVALLQKAMNNAVNYKDWLIAGVGFVEEKYRDTIAIIADYLLQNNDVELVVVYGAVYHNNHTKLDIDASFRTKNEDFDLNELIKNITPDGGGRKYKGAFQVHIDYFVHCPDQDKLWEVIEITTNAILQNQRDHSFAIALQSKFKKLKNILKQLFGFK